MSGLFSGKLINIKEFQKMLGHCYLDILEKTAKIHEFKMSGKFKTCEECVIAKARKKDISKEWKCGIQVSGEQLYLYISSIKDTSYGGSKF
jgi:hypothetical protein